MPDDEWRNLTRAGVKTILWKLLTPKRKKFIAVLEPGSKSFVQDPLAKYIRRLLATFQPAFYTDRRKQEYKIRVHQDGESVEEYIIAKLILFQNANRTDDFKQFLQTGLQSIYPPILRQHIMAQPYRHKEGLMENVADISAYLRSLPSPKPHPTGTLAGIAPPMQRGESQDTRLSKTKPQEVEDSSRQSLRSRDISRPHSRTSEGIAGECQDKRGQEEVVRRWEIQERLTRGQGERSVSPTSKRRSVQEVPTQPTRDGGPPPPQNPS